MSLNTILRQKQIREMLDYDLVQNKRVFDSEIKHVATLNEAEAPPRKSDIEFEAEVKSNVDNIVLQLQRLMNAFDDLGDIKKFEFNYEDDGGDFETASSYQSSLGAPSINTSDLVSSPARNARQELRQEQQDLELTKSLQGIKNNASESISGIYSSFNSLVEKINNKLKFGFSSQGANNILSLLQPIADGAKEVLASAYQLKHNDSSLYNKIYSLLIEMIDIIKEAPPLRRLDVTRIRDDHYTGDYDEPEVNPDTRKILGEEFDDMQDIISNKMQFTRLRDGFQGEIDELQALLDENPDNDEIRDLMEENMQELALVDRAIAELDIALNASRKYSGHATNMESLERSIQELQLTLGKLDSKERKLLDEKSEIELTSSGKRKQTLLSGINKKLQRLNTQIGKTEVALARNKKILEELKEMEIRDRSDEVDEIGEIAQLPQQPAPEKPGKPVRKGAEKEARAIREEERALRQAEIAQGLPAGFTDEEAEVDRLMAEIDAGLLRQGFGKRRGRPSKKGGAKAMTPDQINAVVVARNKAFAANNEATQLPRAPMTYLGLKADNTRGTLGAGKKKDIVMKQKDLVSLLGKTANSLKSEAVEQTDELGKFDPETAKMLEKVVDKEKMKAGKKGKKSTKQLPTLVFDDKKNDWFI